MTSSELNCLGYKHILEKRRVCEINFIKKYEPAVGINHETRSETANTQVFILDAFSNFTASTQIYEVTCMIFPQIS
jgi:hypothetical protein